jgi:hypothetical protein
MQIWKRKKLARSNCHSLWEAKPIEHVETRILRIRLIQHKRIRKGLKKLIEKKLAPIIKEGQSLDNFHEKMIFFHRSFEHVKFKLQRHLLKKMEPKQELDRNNPGRRSMKMGKNY